jgi:hypothetical protein
MSEVDVKEKPVLVYRGIDYWGRPMFQLKGKNCYCSCLEKIFAEWATVEEVKASVTKEDITYHGSEYDSDPIGSILNPDKFEIAWSE